MTERTTPAWGMRGVARVLALVAALPLVPAEVGAQSLDGCQGPSAEATMVAKPTVVFVWPCFAHADTFLEKDSREVERTLDQEMSTQYFRLRERLLATDADLLKASGAVHFRVVGPGAEAEVVRTTVVTWHGVFVLCPSRAVRRLEVTETLASVKWTPISGPAV